MQFDGSNDYVSLPIGSLLSTLTNSTFAIWANYSQQGGAWQRIFDFGTGETVNMFLTPAIGGSNTGVMRFAITIGGSGAESQLTAPSRLATGWHHIAVVINATAMNMQLYLDGAVVVSAATQRLPSHLGNTTQNWLGRSEYGADAYYTGALDDFRIYNRVLTQAEIQTVMLGGGYGTAGDPSPGDNATDVPRDTALSWSPGPFAKTHDVYFGASFADVNSASRTKALGVLASRGQDANSYDPPGVLDLGKTYYWRVDEVNATPDNTIFKGNVWSFTVEPYSYPIRNIKATASSFTTGMGPEKTVNGSGLNAAGEHSTASNDMWLSAKGGAQPTWIQYEFESTCKLDKMQVWNSNQMLESIIGLGARNVLVEYSVDAVTGTTLGEFEFAQAPSLPYVTDTVVNFSGAAARYVKLTIKSNWGGILAQYGLSEVRIYQVPVTAREPSPTPGAVGVHPQVTLSWRSGREAASHQVYLGTEQQAVSAATEPTATTASPAYEASLDLGRTYYWKVVEVNNAMTPKSWASAVWSFSTSDFVVVDDFERYTDNEGNRIYETWEDGWINGTGSQVGNLEAPFAERTIIHGGRQSMPLFYDNSKAPRVSEAQCTFTTAQDWTRHGITTLVLYVRGDATNSPAPLYVKINDRKVLLNAGAPATALAVWKQWNIDLASVGTGLKSVKSLTIGVGDGAGGGKGTLYIDDILLYQAAPAVVVPADPGKNGLVAHYMMENNAQDSSGKNYHGTISGDIGYDKGPSGQAMAFNGTNAYVTLPIGPLLATLTDTTIATNVYFANTGGGWQRIFDFGTGRTVYMFLTPRTGATGPMRFAITTAGGGAAESLVDAPTTLPSGWHHVAIAIDSKTMRMTLYLDGVPVGNAATRLLPKDLGNATQNWLGRSQYWPDDAYFTGSLDEFRIYNRVLSAAEVRYLAGDR
ncbi:MAG: LamG domain-containing protein [Planctomycetes bacterium]|nr:LamG domain-containing protein [Planctomycetota bacterium]